MIFTSGEMRYHSGSMRKIGVLYGMENTFPAALVDRINAMRVEGVEAEHIHIGGVKMAEPSGYRVIVDRISHDIPFYRAYLKNAVLTGTTVINNPFWWGADDKFFNYALASQDRRRRSAAPCCCRTNRIRRAPPSQSMRNLIYPLNWDEIFDYIGFPAFLKPFSGGGWKSVYKVDTPAELFAAYDETGDLCMTLQRAVNFTNISAATWSASRKSTSCATIRASRTLIATCSDGPPIDPAHVRARGGRLPEAVPRAGLRSEHGGVRGGRRHPLRHRFSESGARCGSAIGRRRRISIGSSTPWPNSRSKQALKDPQPVTADALGARVLHWPCK